jgi:IS5 family transposase
MMQTFAWSRRYLYLRTGDIVADRGYCGHNAPHDHKFKVYISGQRRRVTGTIKREPRRRSVVEPVIGHAKAEHRMGRNYLARTRGDAANAVLAAAGYNSRRPLEWLALLLSAILAGLNSAATHDTLLKPA